MPARDALRRLDSRLEPRRLITMREYIGHRLQQPHFANARSIRNALDRIRLRQANRVYDEAMGDNLRVTVVATGLGNREVARSQKPQLVVQRTGTDNQAVGMQVVDYGALAAAPLVEGAACAPPNAKRPWPSRKKSRFSG